MFLDEAKKSYYDVANLLPGWKEKSRSELCRLYVNMKEQNDPLTESCLSAIICKFWNVIQHNYYMQQVKIATPEDCHTWVIDAILFVLDQHVWTDPKSSLYNDLNAPEKCINVCIVNGRINYFVAQQRHKRKVNSFAYSLDALQEDTNQEYLLPYSDDYNLLAESIRQMVKQFFENKEYLKSFVIDVLLNPPTDKIVKKVIEDNISYTTINYNKLQQALLNLNDAFASRFAERYSLSEEMVLAAVMSLYYCGKEYITQELIKSVVEELKQDEAMRELYLGDSE